MKFRLMAAEFFHADGQTDRQTCGKANSRFSQFRERDSLYIFFSIKKNLLSVRNFKSSSEQSNSISTLW